jgi:hypothetical protein
LCPICARDGLKVIFLQFGDHLKILITDNVVAIKYRPGLVTRNHHGNPLGDTGADHVSNRSPSKVVEKPFANAGKLQEASAGSGTEPNILL